MIFRRSVLGSRTEGAPSGSLVGKVNYEHREPSTDYRDLRGNVGDSAIGNRKGIVEGLSGIMPGITKLASLRRFSTASCATPVKKEHASKKSLKADNKKIHYKKEN